MEMGEIKRKGDRVQGFRMQEGTGEEIKLEVKGETETLMETVRGSRVGCKDKSLWERSEEEGVTYYLPVARVFTHSTTHYSVSH